MRTLRHPLAPSRIVPPTRPMMHRPPLLHRLPGPEREAGPAHDLARDRTLAMVEAALFLAEEPLAPRKLAALAGLPDAAEAKRQAARLKELYEKEGSSFEVAELAGGYQLLTRPDLYPWLVRFRRTKEVELTPAARETLAVIAYRQPITRADVEAIRGVGCAEVLRQLMEKGLVKMAGHDDTLGRPMLYETTKKFLQVYGYWSLKELPPVEGLGPPE